MGRNVITIRRRRSVTARNINNTIQSQRPKISQEELNKLRDQAATRQRKVAELESRRLNLGIEQRQDEFRRTTSQLRRQGRQRRAQILAGGAAHGITGSSAFRNARRSIATQTGQEIDFQRRQEQRARQSDQIQREAIQANFSNKVVSDTLALLNKADLGLDIKVPDVLSSLNLQSPNLEKI